MCIIPVHLALASMPSSRARPFDETSLPDARAIRTAISLTAHSAIIDLIVSLHRSLTRREQSNKTGHMRINSRRHPITRRLAASLLAAAVTLSTTAASFAADTVVLRVGDQKGGNRSLLEISGYAKDLPYKIEWSEFPAAAPILEALNAGALDVGYTGDLSFLSVYAAGAPIKAIGGTRSDAKTQAILVRQDSPIKSAADLRGKRLAGTRGGSAHHVVVERDALQSKSSETSAWKGCVCTAVSDVVMRLPGQNEGEETRDITRA